MRRDEVGLDGEPEEPEAVVEAELPYGRVPLRGSALEQLAAPDVVDEHIDVAVGGPDLLGQRFHLDGIEVVDRDRDAGAAEARDDLGGLLDRLGTAVVGPKGSRATTAPRAHDRCSRFSQGRRNATPGPSGRPRHDGHATTQCAAIWRPVHASSVPARREDHKPPTRAA
jgi:hypothetical protein